MEQEPQQQQEENQQNKSENQIQTNSYLGNKSFISKQSFQNPQQQKNCIEIVLEIAQKYEYVLIAVLEHYKNQQKKHQNEEKQRQKLELQKSHINSNKKLLNIILQNKKNSSNYNSKGNIVHVVDLKVKKDFLPPKTRFYQTIQRDFISMNYNTILQVLQPNTDNLVKGQQQKPFMLKDDIKEREQKYKQISDKNPRDLIQEDEIHKLKFYAKRLIQRVDQSLSTMHIFSLIVGKSHQQVGQKIWFPVINQYFTEEQNKLLLSKEIQSKVNKVKPYKFINFFCSICMKFNCLIHFDKSENYQNGNYQNQSYNLGYYQETYQFSNEETYTDYSQRGKIVNKSAKLRKNEDYNTKNKYIQHHNLFRCKNQQFCCFSEENQKSIEDGKSIYEQKKSIKFIKQALKKNVGKKYQIEFVRYATKANLGSPCFISYALNDGKLTCATVKLIQVFLEVIQQLEEKKQIGLVTQQPKKYQPGQSQATSNQISEKIQIKYNACSHKGPCTKENQCTCMERGKCEKYCLCQQNCRHRYQGCNCKNGCQINESGTKQQICPCFLAGRECDPDLCSCDSNRNCKTIVRQKNAQLFCHNTNITYKMKTRLILQKSIVCDGLGIVAGQFFKAGDFIGEYNGELITKDESYYKDEIYQELGIHYFFNKGYDDQINCDPFLTGTKVRFLNYVHGDILENCKVQYIFVQGQCRIALFAIKDIYPGTELFFNYGDGYKVDWKQEFDKECESFSIQYNKKSDKPLIDRLREEDEQNIKDGFKKLALSQKRQFIQSNIQTAEEEIFQNIINDINNLKIKTKKHKQELKQRQEQLMANLKNQEVIEDSDSVEEIVQPKTQKQNKFQNEQQMEEDSDSSIKEIQNLENQDKKQKFNKNKKNKESDEDDDDDAIEQEMAELISIDDEENHYNKDDNEEQQEYFIED